MKSLKNEKKLFQISVHQKVFAEEKKRNIFEMLLLALCMILRNARSFRKSFIKILKEDRITFPLIPSMIWFDFCFYWFGFAFRGMTLY